MRLGMFGSGLSAFRGGGKGVKCPSSTTKNKGKGQLEEDKDKVTTFFHRSLLHYCWFWRRRRKENCMSSLLLTFKVTAWLPLLLTSLPWLALDTRKEKVRESRKSKERKLLSFGKEPQQSNCSLLVQKGRKRMGEREKWTSFR